MRGKVKTVKRAFTYAPPCIIGLEIIFNVYIFIRINERNTENYEIKM
jgi:hypothetical protein